MNNLQDVNVLFEVAGGERTAETDARRVVERRLLDVDQLQVLERVRVARQVCVG